MNSVLYIFLPCKKVYPIGITYLADFIHRRKPEVRQRILDLSLFPVRNGPAPSGRSPPSFSRISSASLGGIFKSSRLMRAIFPGARVQFLFCEQSHQAHCRVLRRTETAVPVLQPYPYDPLLSLVGAERISQGPDHDRRRSLHRLRRPVHREIAGRHHWPARRGRRCDFESARRTIHRGERYIIKEGNQIKKGRQGSRHCSMP